MTAPFTTLLVDAGNTRVKFGLISRGETRRKSETLALAHADLEQLPQWLSNVQQKPARAIGVNVAGDALAVRIDALCSQSGAEGMQWVHSTREAVGIRNTYEVPGQLGSDRWVALLGLATHTAGAALLASFGTATTIDALSAPDTSARRFEGGVILPGPELMLRALANGTAQLPYAEGEVTPLPRNTHSAIRSGVAAAQAGAVLRQWRAAADAFGAEPEVFCTGGGWPLVAAEVSAQLARLYADLGLKARPARWLDAPVLDGLASLALQP